MPKMIDPTDGMVSFQQALLAGKIKLEKCVIDPTISVHMDRPEESVRLTYVRLSPKNIVQAIAIFTPAEPIERQTAFQVGYAVPPANRGKGLAKGIVEAGIAELKNGFSRNGVKAFWVEAVIGANNLASKRVAESVLSTSGKEVIDSHSGETAVQYLRKVE